MYAVVKTGGKQYKVEVGETLPVEHLDALPSSLVTLPALLVSDGDKVLTGEKAGKATVTAEVVGHGKADKVIVFKFKKRKGYKKLRGHRQDLTLIKITDIVMPGGKAASKAVEAASTATAAQAPAKAAPRPAAAKPAAAKAAAKKAAPKKAAAPKAAVKPAAAAKSPEKPAAAAKATAVKAAPKPAEKKPAAKKPASKAPAAKKADTETKPPRARKPAAKKDEKPADSAE